MFGLLLRIRSQPGRYFVVPFLIVALAFIGPAAIAQTLCPPDCAMHKPAPAPPSCCENSAMEHEAMETAGNTSHAVPAPEPCCEGKLCLDASASAPELTIALSSIESAINAPAAPYEQAHPRTSISPVGRSFERHIKGPPIPVYIRTCVFLI